jgi:hypothetical protein
MSEHSNGYACDISYSFNDKNGIQCNSQEFTTMNSPALRDKGSKALSIWQHGDVRLLCNNHSCRGRCDATCHVENENNVSFSLALRCCNHSSIIDTETDTPPLSNDDRERLQRPPLNDAQKERDINATIELQKYYQSGSKAVFDAWLLQATWKVLDEYYDISIEKKHKK